MGKLATYWSGFEGVIGRVFRKSTGRKVLVLILATILLWYGKIGEEWWFWIALAVIGGVTLQNVAHGLGNGLNGSKRGGLGGTLPDASPQPTRGTDTEEEPSP